MTTQSTIAIVGMGSSGQSAAKLALTLGHNVLCIDRNVCQVPEGCIFSLEENATLKNVSVVVVSPGVPSHNSVIQTALNQRLAIISELNFASKHLTTPMIAVTGTNGKSSTVWYAKQMAEQLGLNVFLGGNFGCALSEMVIDTLKNNTHYDLAIVEVSSYQLEWSLDVRPNSASILNLTPDHLARHKSLEEYKRCKLKLFEHQTVNDRAVLPLSPSDIHPKTDGIKRYFGNVKERHNERGCFASTDGLHWFDDQQEWSIQRENIPLLGEHNLHNVAAALLLIEPFTFQSLNAEICMNLMALEHRLEPVWVNKRLWINDSKATNIEATEAALRSMTEPVTLFLGGAGKQGADYTQLKDLLLKHTSRVICFGASGNEIHSQLSTILPENIQCSLTVDLSSAIQLARLKDDHRPVLLSPACASFDAFTNFEHRGRFFKETLLESEAV
jgi:UDP-N-acetylmuramoylalanine--D-glutamate ligase